MNFALNCRKVNDLGANPDYLDSFYDWDAPTAFVTWGSQGFVSGPYGEPDTGMEGMWALARAGLEPPKLKRWVRHHSSSYEFSGQAEEVQWVQSSEEFLVDSVSITGASTNAWGSCATSMYDVDISLNSSPYTTLHFVRGLRVYRYTPVFQPNTLWLGGFALLCQTLQRAELSTSAPAVALQPASLGLGVSTLGGQNVVAAAGQTFAYTFDVNNDSTEPATGVTLVTKLDGGTTFVSASSSRGDCLRSGVDVTCPLGSLSPASSVSVTITVTAPSSEAVVTDSATLSAASGELSAERSSAYRTTIVYGSTNPTPGDLSVSVADGVESVDAGGSLTYTVTVSNQSSQGIGGVSVVDPLPGGVDLVSAASSQGWCAVVGGTVVCSLGVLDAGASATVSVGVTSPSTPGAITNDVTVSGSSAGGAEWVTTAGETTIVSTAGETTEPTVVGPAYGWELAGQFDGEMLGFQGTDSGKDVACPDGYLVVAGGVAYDKVGLVLTTRGISLRCRKVNELGANPNWLHSFYDWDEVTTIKAWGSNVGGGSVTVVSYGSPNAVVEGLWVKTRKGIEPPKLKPWVNRHVSQYDFSGLSADVQFDRANEGLFYGSDVHKPFTFDFGACSGSGYYGVGGSMNDSPYTTVHAVRGLRIYRYTPAFSTQQMIGGFTLDRRLYPAVPDASARRAVYTVAGPDVPARSAGPGRLHPRGTNCGGARRPDFQLQNRREQRFHTACHRSYVGDKAGR